MIRKFLWEGVTGPEAGLRVPGRLRRWLVSVYPFWIMLIAYCDTWSSVVTVCALA
jgi:hypothetical protein